MPDRRKEPLLPTPHPSFLFLSFLSRLPPLCLGLAVGVLLRVDLALRGGGGRLGGSPPLPLRAVPDVHRLQAPVPKGEEGLGEVGLDAPGLVVDVVVGRVVARDVLHGVPRERVPAVVVDRLDGREAEEEGALADRHEGELVADAGAERVEEEALKGVVVEGAVCVGDVEAVVAGVEGC